MPNVWALRRKRWYFSEPLFVILVLFWLLKAKGIDLHMTRSTLLKVFVVGVFGMTSAVLLLYTAYHYLPVGTVTLMTWMDKRREANTAK